MTEGGENTSIGTILDSYLETICEFEVLGRVGAICLVPLSVDEGHVDNACRRIKAQLECCSGQ